eukprot:9516062-Alexandrium_andersonii.AAC.1
MPFGCLGIGRAAVRGGSLRTETIMAPFGTGSRREGVRESGATGSRARPGCVSLTLRLGKVALALRCPRTPIPRLRV